MVVRQEVADFIEARDGFHANAEVMRARWGWGALVGVSGRFEITRKDDGLHF